MAFEWFWIASHPTSKALESCDKNLQKPFENVTVCDLETAYYTWFGLGNILVVGLMADSVEFEAEIQKFRPYLLVLARGQIPNWLQGRIEASDIVQDTLLEAFRKQTDFRGSNVQTLAGWLRSLLSFNMIDAVRRHQRQSRDVAREIRAPRSIEESALGLEGLLIADQSTPSHHFATEQRAIQLAIAIEALPESQRDAILMRYSQSMSLAEIGATMKKTNVAIAGLLKRGLANLRVALARSQSSDFGSPSS